MEPFSHDTSRLHVSKKWVVLFINKSKMTAFDILSLRSWLTRQLGFDDFQLPSESQILMWFKRSFASLPQLSDWLEERVRNTPDIHFKQLSSELSHYIAGQSRFDFDYIPTSFTVDSGHSSSSNHSSAPNHKPSSSHTDSSKRPAYHSDKFRDDQRNNGRPHNNQENRRGNQMIVETRHATISGTNQTKSEITATITTLPGPPLLLIKPRLLHSLHTATSKHHIHLHLLLISPNSSSRRSGLLPSLHMDRSNHL